MTPMRRREERSKMIVHNSHSQNEAYPPRPEQRSSTPPPGPEGGPSMHLRSDGLKASPIRPNPRAALDDGSQMSISQSESFGSRSSSSDRKHVRKISHSDATEFSNSDLQSVRRPLPVRPPQGSSPPRDHPSPIRQTPSSAGRPHFDGESSRSPGSTCRPSPIRSKQYNSIGVSPSFDGSSSIPRHRERAPYDESPAFYAPHSKEPAHPTHYPREPGSEGHPNVISPPHRYPPHPQGNESGQGRPLPHGGSFDQRNRSFDQGSDFHHPQGPSYGYSPYHDPRDRYNGYSPQRGPYASQGMGSPRRRYPEDGHPPQPYPHGQDYPQGYNGYPPALHYQGAPPGYPGNPPQSWESPYHPKSQSHSWDSHDKSPHGPQGVCPDEPKYSYTFGGGGGFNGSFGGFNGSFGGSWDGDEAHNNWNSGGEQWNNEPQSPYYQGNDDWMRSSRRDMRSHRHGMHDNGQHYQDDGTVVTSNESQRQASEGSHGSRQQDGSGFEDVTLYSKNRLQELLQLSSPSTSKTGIPPLVILPPGEDNVTDVKNNDVLLGRGGGTNTQTGNRRFRQVVVSHQPMYLKARRKEKPLIARCIVELIRKRGGRFLKKDDKSGKWGEVGDERAEAKTSQALREGLDVRATKNAVNNLVGSNGKKKSDDASSDSKSDHTEDKNSPSRSCLKDQRSDKENNDCNQDYSQCDSSKRLFRSNNQGDSPKRIKWMEEPSDSFMRPSITTAMSQEDQKLFQDFNPPSPKNNAASSQQSTLVAPNYDQYGE
eukprot:CAMPEP_0195513598 /NCGR_PEP_ID=MMETSP0794_2-20130614/5212_1 /TAXON_ID=515487 /ORGANISM="Stephanopyxis turris, Strain CCMP 815" /LENGTH=763 /DNA_ID=CAMNT_0040641653 /DNA_START=241 /DNA_END=2532 /DNA_ORIENTATION=+